jgi:hypothetical protein
MRGEQRSWEVNPDGLFDSPELSAGLSEDTAPQFEDQPNNKKKYVYRKEVQKSYRQRVKSKHADIEAAVAASSQELHGLVSSNRYLNDNKQGLELLNIEGVHLYNALRNMAAKSVLAKQPGRDFSAADPDKIAHHLLDLVFSDGKFEDEQLKYYITLPSPVLIKTEADFIKRLDLLMGEWNVCLSSREKIERRLSKAL